MYVIKRNSDYFTGADFSPLQRDAKRFNIALTPMSSFPSHIFMLFGESARFVKLKAKGYSVNGDARLMRDVFDDNEWP